MAERFEVDGQLPPPLDFNRSAHQVLARHFQMFDQTFSPIIVAAAGLAEMTQQEQRELDVAIFIGSLVPLVLYVLVAGGCWITIYRKWLRSKRLSVQSILVGTAFIAPTLILAKLVAVPYWWYD